jgi:GMP synthase (glutamine-hydrolysing)
MGETPGLSAMSKKRAVIFQHAPTEGPERVGELCLERGAELEVRHLYGGEAVPKDLGPDEILVVMGGPMGVGDVGDPRYGFLAQEIALLRALIARDHPVVGICLGAQLLASAAGAAVYPNTRRSAEGLIVPVREVGWAPVTFIGVDREPALQGLPTREMMLHWHGDTFDLPPDAVQLAATESCAQQGFRLKQRVYGLQFHCEPGPATIATWVREDADFVALANGPAGGERILADTKRYFGAAAPAWDRLLRNILALVMPG